MFYTFGLKLNKIMNLSPQKYSLYSKIMSNFLGSLGYYNLIQYNTIQYNTIQTPRVIYRKFAIYMQCIACLLSTKHLKHYKLK